MACPVTGLPSAASDWLVGNIYNSRFTKAGYKMVTFEGENKASDACTNGNKQQAGFMANCVQINKHIPPWPSQHSAPRD